MNKLAIVTGAAGNMGRAVVNKFLEENYSVVGTIVPGDATTAGISHERFERMEVDLMNEEPTEKFIQTVIEKYASIDVAVLTVGGFALGNIVDTGSADILKQYRLNFETAYHVARPVFSQMLQQGSGRIFLVGSRPGLSAKEGKGMVGYGLAKSLIFRLAELMNEEANGTNVVVNVLVPSTIDTPQNRESMPAADFSGWVKPEQIADTIFFYSSDEASPLREAVIKLYNKS